MSWMNSDKLLVKFNKEVGTVTTGGARAFPGNGGLTIVEFDLTLVNLVTAGSTGGAILFDNIIIPAKARFEKVEIVCTTIADSTSDTAKLNLGLTKLDRTTEGDWDGILDSVAQADADVVNELKTVTVVTSGAGGALMGAPAAYPGYLSAYWETEAFTVGVWKVRLYYSLSANVLGSANDTIA